MFILRRIAGDGTEFGQVIGDSYTLFHKNKQPDEFEKQRKAMYGDLYKNECFAIILSGKVKQPIYRGQTNLIMCSDGNVFDNLTI